MTQPAFAMGSPLAPPSDERGMILINVLIIVMLATAILAVILATEQDDVDRTTALRSAAQAQATARGAELTAIAALRRDLARGSESDTLRDEWATIGDRDARIPGGRFSFAVADAQARFNVNNLARGDVLSRDTFIGVAQAASLPPGAADRIIAMIGLTGAIGDLSDLRVTGLDSADLQRLAALCTALPQPTEVNVNTAPEALLAVLFESDVTARTLVGLRDRDGLSTEAMQAGHILLPPGAGLRSDYFWARGRVTMADTNQQLTSLIFRHVEQGKPVAMAIRMWRGTAPIAAPPLT